MLTRRRFLSTTLGGPAALAVGRLGLVSGQEAAAKPNVLFIAIDDLNDWVGCLGGHPDVKTPNMDRLGARGVVFERAYCTAPACNPSRASLMTGIRPSTSGVYHNPQPWRPAMPDAVTLQEAFKAAGYTVLGRGKVYHHGTGEQFFTQKGWDHYIPKGGDPVPPKRPVNGIPNAAHFDWGPVDVSDEEMDDFKVATWVGEQLGKSYDKPLFLACGIFRPHLPWYVPKKYFDLYPLDKITLPNVNENDLDDVPPIARQIARPEGDHKKVIDHNQWRQAVQGYLASISFCDAMVGKVLDALDKSPHAKNTIVVFWGDHGWHLGEKLHWRKFALWEEATHAPFMMAVPGVTKPAGRCARTVSFLDIYPTLADLCGLERPKTLEGVSLLPLLKEPTGAWDRPAVTTYGKDNHSVRAEKWRYIRYRDGSEELYDEEKDPLEWTNLAAKPKSKEIKDKLAAWLPKVNAPDATGAPRPQRKGKAQTTK
ncbi:MAG TPA: sulfatase [Planctomycetota bacterium]|nr:sulfatase [Planctomycetota bacterium]